MEILQWPDDVAQKIGVSAKHLQNGRAVGDAPKLYAASERRLVTTAEDVLEWLKAKQVPTGYRCRPATSGSGAKAAA